MLLEGLLYRRRGSVMVEYLIMVAVFAILLIIAVGLMRQSVEDGYRDVCLALKDVVIVDMDCGSAEPAPTS